MDFHSVDACGSRFPPLPSRIRRTGNTPACHGPDPPYSTPSPLRPSPHLKKTSRPSPLWPFGRLALQPFDAMDATDEAAKLQKLSMKLADRLHGVEGKARIHRTSRIHGGGSAGSSGSAFPSGGGWWFMAWRLSRGGVGELLVVRGPQTLHFTRPDTGQGATFYFPEPGLSTQLLCFLRIAQSLSSNRQGAVWP